MLGFLALVLLWGIVHQRGQYESRIEQLEQKISQLEAQIEAQREASGGGEEALYGFPIVAEDYLFPTSPYGIRHSPVDGELREHRGVDLLGVWKARVVAIEDGVVVDHYPVSDGHTWKGHPVLGGMVRIRHPDGSISVYGHLSWTCVHEQQQVVRGQIIGWQGATGICQSEHLHFELMMNDQHVNPLRYLEIPDN